MPSLTRALAAPRSRPKDRWLILSALAAVTAGAWIYLALQAHHMSAGMTTDSMGSSTGSAMQTIAGTQPWTAGEYGVRLVMWAVMMVAMMAPTAAPMTLVYAAVARRAERDGLPVAPTSMFVAGYFAVWGLFSVAATTVQLGLEHAALLSPRMVLASPWLGAALVAVTGIYELTPYKHACLSHCRAPAHFISQHWRRGPYGALRMGSQLGLYCLGCCWVLMALLFVGGVMNLLWIAAIAALVLLEKTVPFADVGARLVGAGLILVGVGALTDIALT